MPVLIAIQFSFNDGRSRSAWQGFTTKWYCCGNEPGSVGVGDHDALLLVAAEQSRCWRW